MRKKWIAVVLLFVTLLNLSACGASDNYESNEKDVTEQSKDFKENEFSTEDIINRAFTKACRETDGMSVVMRVKDRFSGSYGSTKYNSDITINSPVEFKNDKTYMSENEYEFRTVATSYGNVENALDIFNAVSDSEEHSEQVHSQIYSTDDGTVWQTMETYNSDDGEWQGDWQQFHEIDTTAKEFDENKAESLTKAQEVENQAENMDEWKQLYIDHLNSEDRPHATYILINMDDNPVPQMVYMLNEISGYGAEFVSVADGKLNVTHVDGGYFTYYNPAEHTVYSYGGKMGSYYDSVYSYANGVLTRIHSGEWTEDMDENEEVVYTYNWDGEDVSEEEYNTYLESVYDTSAGVELDWEADWYTKEEIIQMIADY